MRFRPVALATSAVVLVTLSACSAPPSATGTAQPTQSTAASSATSQAQPLPRDNSTQQSQPAQALPPAAASEAATTSATAMTLYARPSLDAQTWIDGLDPYLTQGAAAAFAGTDPSTIPAHHVTGSGQILPASTAEGALIDVPTDAGTYQLLLLKNGSGWLVDQITPPKN